MIILNYIRDIKKYVEVEESDSFKDVLLKAMKYKELLTIVDYFNNINIKENGSIIHLKYNTKFMFKKTWDEFYEKSRGLVLDWKTEDLLLYPFDKFYELDEHSSSQLSIIKGLWDEDVEITEKIDGSLISARYINDNYLVASSGSLEGYHVKKAQDLIEKDLNVRKFLKSFVNYTIIFEMKIKDLPQHIKYNKDSLTIIGMRNMDTLELLTLKQIHELVLGYEVSVVSNFNKTIKELLIEIEDPNTLIEGYVVRIGSLIVKFKTRNFILANRFKGEHIRNFNVLVISINEGRVKSLSELVSIDYKESYDKGIELFNLYADNKLSILTDMVKNLDLTLSNDDFARECVKLYPDYVNKLMSYKINREVNLNKADINHLKKYSSYFTCVSHIKYSELNNLCILEVEKAIKTGELKYIKSYDSYNDEKIYIIHKWQFLNIDEMLK